MRCWVPPVVVSLVLFFAPWRGLLAADATVDQLLKKLPPPEKFVKSPTDRIVVDLQTLKDDKVTRKIVTALRSRDFNRALDQSRELAKRHPDNAIAQTLNGVIAYALRQYGEAAEACHRAIRLQPNYVEPHAGLGFIELAQKRPAAAIPHFQKFAELRPKEPAPWLLLSACYERLDQKQKALEMATRATEVSPAAAGAWVQLARTEKAVGHTDGTLRAMLRAADLLPDSAYILATVGYGYINLNRIREAVPPLQRAARFSPNDFLIQSQLGFCLLSVGQTDTAIEHLRAGSKLNPNYAPVWEHLGLAYIKQGRHRQAVESFERAIKITPNYQQAWQHLATEYQAVGRTADAQQAALRASRLQPQTTASSRKKR